MSNFNLTNCYINVNDKIVFLKKHNNDVNVNKYKYREKFNIYQEIAQSN